MKRSIGALNVALLGAFLLAACGRDESIQPAQSSVEALRECNQVSEGVRAECLRKATAVDLSASVRPESTQAGVLPEILRTYLQKNPSFRLLDAADIRAHPEFVARDGDKHAAARTIYLQEYLAKEFQRFRLADTNRDGLKDLVAIIVDSGKFHVLVFQGDQQGFSAEPHWVLRDETDGLAGIHIAESGAIFPLYCIACDSNPFFVWTGEEYERNASPVGAVVCLQEKTRLYSTASYQARIVHETSGMVEATVIEIGPHEPSTAVEKKEYRWYKVKLKKGSGHLGFARSYAFVDGSGLCE